MMQHLPVFLDVKGRDALVVGGGEAAVRKVGLLVDAGSNVIVVAPRCGESLRAKAGAGKVRLIARPFAAEDVAGQAVVIAATGVPEVDVQVSEAAIAAGIPVNVVDAPELSTFIVPAIVDRDPITVAVSTAGTAPVLARAVRAKIEALLPANIGRLALFAEGFRRAVKANHPELRARRRFWERFFSGPVAEAVLSGEETWARERMLATVNRPLSDCLPDGVVHIVGAGPGNPDLLTLRAFRLLQEADVIVHDRLVAPEILGYARRDAQRIDVGKAKGAHALSQRQINEVLLREVRAGRRVVRLKGGDPFIFGRGGEELEFLARHGIRAEVVAGITAATGCAATAGIPLTHRDHAQAVVLITGHGKDGEPDVDWAALARQRQTIAVYMGASIAGRIAARLISGGMDPATPAAVITNGTRSDQHVETGFVGELESLAARTAGGPALIVVGDVVRQADAWVAADVRRAAVG
jgi:uroporphyrin-III C-methyltransferase/precorrin-2 dehydrogenase/sirohydrochlorin ferrochelatase